MALSFIGAGAAQANTVTIPAGHATGDLLLMFAFRDGSTTSPSIPAGWTSVGLNSGTLCASTVAYKVATSSSETSGTWTNADALVCHVYRGQLTGSAPVVNSGAQTGTGTTVNYSGITTMTDPGNSWVARFAGHAATDTSLESPPTGHTFRAGNSGATCEVAGFDTNGAVSSSSFAGVSVGGTSNNWISKTLEILAAPTNQTHTAQSVSANTLDNTFSNNTTTGNTIVVIAGAASSATTVTSVTDSQGNTYTKINGSGTANRVEIWYARNITGGTTPTVTVNFSSTTSVSTIIREYVNTLPYLLDKFVAANGGPSTSQSSGATSTTTVANELVVGYSVIQVNTTFTAGAGYGNLSQIGNSGGFAIAIEDMTVSSTGTQTATTTSVGNASWTCGVATFYESAVTASSSGFFALF